MHALSSGPNLIDDEFGKFPRYMSLIPDVFSFSYEEAFKATKRFKNNSDLAQAFETLREFVLASELPDEQKDELAQLISDEMEVISYAVVSRTCVVSI
ncbi:MULTISPECIES: hypothetical protein [Chelativorans]|jgi:hypothetical protein|uniref:Uncharacterized protein n=1 Tax=Chelativorans sp. (strain BNC1) TaxID=266779 RepID=Q11M46_CHESB|nr:MULTISPECIES: hypothetical protein [Chelativorans]